MWIEHVAQIVKHIYPQAAEIGLTGNDDNPISRIFDADDKPLDIPTNATLEATWALIDTPPIEITLEELKARIIALEGDVNTRLSAVEGSVSLLAVKELP